MHLQTPGSNRACVETTAAHVSASTCKWSEWLKFPPHCGQVASCVLRDLSRSLLQLEVLVADDANHQDRTDISVNKK